MLDIHSDLWYNLTVLLGIFIQFATKFDIEENYTTRLAARLEE